MRATDDLVPFPTRFAAVMPCPACQFPSKAVSTIRTAPNGEMQRDYDCEAPLGECVLKEGWTESWSPTTVQERSFNAAWAHEIMARRRRERTYEEIGEIELRARGIPVW